MAKYTDKAEFQIPRHIVFKNGVNIEAITDNKTLTYESSSHQIFTLTSVSAKTCMLPLEKDGAYFYIRNESASTHDINVNIVSTGATIATLASSGECGLFVCDGSNWKMLFKA